MALTGNHLLLLNHITSSITFTQSTAPRAKTELVLPPLTHARARLPNDSKGSYLNHFSQQQHQPRRPRRPSSSEGEGDITPISPPPPSASILTSCLLGNKFLHSFRIGEGCCISQPPETADDLEVSLFTMNCRCVSCRRRPPLRAAACPAASAPSLPSLCRSLSTAAYPSTD